ncbi:AI-2E family transporter [Rothia sp. CCM 9418]|uniref:AI-2E family transporter n=1 Tax=Rothia sp. CCM 9418 TaxID=3402661 RepID=UPI003ADC35AD
MSETTPSPAPKNHIEQSSWYHGDERYIPFALRTAAAWSWRLLIVLFALACLHWVAAKISIIIVSIAVAVLLAALISPAVFFLRKYGLRRGYATAIVELGFIAVVVGLLTLVGQQITSGFSSLSDEIVQGYHTVLGMIDQSPLTLDLKEIDSHFSEFTQFIKNNSGSILSGVASLGSTAADIGTGTALVLFTLIFFLLEGERIWIFLVGLFPVTAREAVNGAGRRGWRSLVSYVHVQVFVAFVDALGIGLAAFFLGVPLAIPLGVLVFLGSFIPIVGALVTGAIAVLLALVANGWFNALIMLLMVLLVQQIESHILQPLVMGKAVSLHPLAVIFAVASGTILYGPLGALFSVPVLAVMNTIVRYLARREWEKDPEIRTKEFLYEHEIARKKRKAVADKVKERLERLKEHEQEESTL